MTTRRSGAGLRRAWWPALLACALAACSGDGPPADVAFTVEVTPQPPHVGTATVEARLATAGGAPVEGATLHVEGNMSHAGMVPELAEAVEVQPGLYRAELELSMGGDWLLLLTADLPGGGSAEHVHELFGVRAERGP